MTLCSSSRSAGPRSAGPAASGSRARAGCCPRGRRSPSVGSPTALPPARRRCVCCGRWRTAGRWATPRGCSEGRASAEHRFPAAVEHLTRAVDATREAGFAAAEAHHLANLGRAYEQAGDRATAAATLERSVGTACAAGDRRTAALASARLGPVLRVVGDPDGAREHAEEARRWYAASGGGEGLLLAEYVLAALDADRADAMASQRLASVLAKAREGRNLEVELLTLDALALHAARTGRREAAAATLEAAERLVPAADHLVTDGDRVDARVARPLLTSRT